MNKNIRDIKFIHWSAYVTIVFTTIILLSWVFSFTNISFLFPGNATMKFNTALLFLLTALVILGCIKTNRKKYLIFIISSSVIILFSSVFTLLEYILHTDFGIDDLFVKDKISTIYPGRMSIATATSFALLSSSMIFTSILKRIKLSIRITQTINVFVSLLAVTSIISFVLQIPISQKHVFFNTMSIYTSILFFVMSVSLSLTNGRVGFYLFLLPNQKNNRLLKILLIIITFPTTLGAILIWLVNTNRLEFSFGVVLYTVVVIYGLSAYFIFLTAIIRKSAKQEEILQDKLKVSNQNLTLFRNAISSALIMSITDEKGIIKYVNEKFCESSGYTNEELIGKDHYIINSNYHSNDYFTPLMSTVRSGEIWSGEVKNVAKNGKEFWVDLRVIPMQNFKKDRKELLFIRQDITDRKSKELIERNNYIKQLETQNKELEQFAYIASHDLQEPLRTVLNFTRLFEDRHGETLNEESKLFFRYIKEASTRMSELIKDLLDYSRIGKNDEFKKVNLNDIMNEVNHLLIDKINQSNAKIEYNFLPSLPIYKRVFTQLLVNLISNGIKFQEKGHQPKIFISAQELDNEWLFSVSDNGIGIPEEQRSKIFTIFQRLHLKNEFEGTGIGLAHCVKIINLHEGRIWVEDNPLEKGSIFKFTISKHIKLK